MYYLRVQILASETKFSNRGHAHQLPWPSSETQRRETTVSASMNYLAAGNTHQQVEEGLLHRHVPVTQV